MIKNFKCRETRNLFLYNETSKKLPPEIRVRAVQKLILIDTAINIHELRLPPGNKLERLKGESLDQYSIRVNDQWRIRFEFQNGNAYDVEIVDYH